MDTYRTTPALHEHRYLSLGSTARLSEADRRSRSPRRSRPERLLRRRGVAAEGVIGVRSAVIRTSAALTITAVLFLTLGVGVASAAPADRSTQPVVQVWDGTPVGTSSLVRTDTGISASFHSSGLPAGQAVTLWFVVFNTPGACTAPGCGLDDILFNPAAGADFLVGAGHVIGGSGIGNFGGHLAVGDTSGSAFPEIGMPDRPVGLTNPRGAQVGLLVHSHGPALTGTDLAAQLSSFTGGCTVFLGDLELPGSGIADGPEDVPDAVGECSTLYASVHMP
jgi:hypothetical protein